MPFSLRLPSLCAFVLACASIVPAQEPTGEGARPNLRVLCWENYFAADTLPAFEKEVGCTIELQTYASNDELEARLMGGLVGVDVIFPSEFMVKKLIDGRFLAELDHARLPNEKHLAARFLKLACDKTNKFALPYMWGTIGIGVNRVKVHGRTDTLAVLFAPEAKGQVLLPDDARSCLGMALKYLGKSANSRSRTDIEKAKQLLLDLEPRIARGADASIIDRLADGTVHRALGYNGDVLTARKKNPSVFYSVPEEGTILWCDHMCILQSSVNKDLAHRFIDYLMRPEVAAAITNEIFFASANDAAEKLVNPEILKDRAVYPVKRILEKSEFQEILGPSQQLYDDAWREISGR